MSGQLVIQANHSMAKFRCVLCGGEFTPLPEYGPYLGGKPLCVICGYETDKNLTQMVDDWVWNYECNP